MTENDQNMKPQQEYWVGHFKQNHDYGHLRFKKLKDSIYPSYNFDESLIDAVDLETFIKEEANRIPFLVSNKFGIYPRIFENQKIFYFKRKIAILYKDKITEKVVGLGIGKTQSGPSGIEFMDRLIFFENKPVQLLNEGEKKNDDKNKLSREKHQKVKEYFATYLILTILYFVASYSVRIGLDYVHTGNETGRLFLSIIILLVFYGIGQFGTYLFFTTAHKFSSLLVCLCLIIGMFNIPYMYYIHLRTFIFMTGISAIIGLVILMPTKRERIIKLNTIILIFLLSIVITLYNPFFQFVFTKERWIVIDILTVFVFASILFYKNFHFLTTRPILPQQDKIIESSKTDWNIPMEESSKTEKNGYNKKHTMDVYCLKHKKVIEDPVDCKDYYFVGAPYHGMGMHNSCLTCKHKLVFNSPKELETILEELNKNS